MPVVTGEDVRVEAWFWLTGFGVAVSSGAKSVGLATTVTIGSSPCRGITVPPPWMLEVACVVQVAMPGELGAIASKVSITLSPCFSTAFPPVAVRFISVVDRVGIHDDGRFRIVIGDKTVNPSGIAIVAEPSVAPSPVLVMFIVYVTSWLTLASAGDIATVNASNFA